jgi:hypothetical protein
MQDLMFYVLVFTACLSLYFLHDVDSFAINKLRRTCLMGSRMIYFLRPFFKRITVIFLQWNTKTRVFIKTKYDYYYYSIIQLKKWNIYVGAGNFLIEPKQSNCYLFPPMKQTDLSVLCLCFSGLSSSCIFFK